MVVGLWSISADIYTVNSVGIQEYGSRCKVRKKEANNKEGKPIWYGKYGKYGIMAHHMLN